MTRTASALGAHASNRREILTSHNDSTVANCSMGIALGLAMPTYWVGLGISAGHTLQSAAGPSVPMVAL